MADAMRAEDKAGTTRGSKQGSRPDVQRVRADHGSKGKPSFATAYGFGLVTVALFLLSWTGQLFTQLMTVRNENSQR